MDSGLSFDEFMEDSQLGGYAIPDLSTTQYQMTLYRAADGMPPRPGDIERLSEVTGRTEWPCEVSDEVWNIWPRRSRKTQLNTGRAVWHGIDDSHLQYIARGERCKIRFTCPSKSQAQDAFQFLLGFLEAPMLAPLVENVTADSVALNTRVDIQVQPASPRTSRGGTTKAWFFDESAFLYIDGHNAFPELLAAARPSLATIPNARLYSTTSAGRQAGPPYEVFRDHWGKPSRIMVSKGPIELFNPTISRELVDSALAQDPHRAKAEWLSEFRTDLSSALAQEWIDACLILPDRPIPRSEHLSWNFHAHFDASGGMNDSAALCIAHVPPGSKEITTNFLRVWPAPHSPEQVIAEAVNYLRDYGCNSVVGDAYAAAWVSDAYSRHGINYKRSELNRSQLYLELTPLMATSKIAVQDNQTLRRELAALERRARSGGRDTVDHPVGMHDDAAVVFAGACVHAWRSLSNDFGIIEGFEPDPFTPDAEIACELIEARHPADWDF